MASNSVKDRPAILLRSEKTSPEQVGDVLPTAVRKITDIDVTYEYASYATVAFTKDHSLYCIGKQRYGVQYQGRLEGTDKNLTFRPGPNNKDIPGWAFGPEIRNNADPLAIGPTPSNEAHSRWWELK